MSLVITTGPPTAATSDLLVSVIDPFVHNRRTTLAKLKHQRHNADGLKAEHHKMMLKLQASSDKQAWLQALLYENEIDPLADTEPVGSGQCETDGSAGPAKLSSRPEPAPVSASSHHSNADASATASPPDAQDTEGEGCVARKRLKPLSSLAKVMGRPFVPYPSSRFVCNPSHVRPVSQAMLTSQRHAVNHGLTVRLLRAPLWSGSDLAAGVSLEGAVQTYIQGERLARNLKS